MTKLKDLSVASNADTNFKKGTFLCNPWVNRNVDEESIHELSWGIYMYWQTSLELLER